MLNHDEEDQRGDDRAPLIANGTNSNQGSRSKRVAVVEPVVEGDLPSEPAIHSNQSSASKRRPRSQSFIDEALDKEKEQREQNLTVRQRYKPAFIIGVFAFLVTVSQLSQPFLPERKKKYFGSDKEAAEIQSIIDCVSAFFGVLLASAYGKLSDRFGRRPFFLLFAFANFVTQATVALVPGNILVAMITNGVAKLVQQSFLFAWLADCYSSKMRMQVVAFISAVGAFSSLFMIATVFMSFQMTAYVCLGISVILMLYAFFVIEETLPEERRIQLTLDDVAHNPFAAIVDLAKSKVAAGLTAILFLYSVAQVGTGDIYMFYLNERVGFTSSDNAYLVCGAGITEPIFYLLVLPRMLRLFSPSMIILFTLFALILELVTIVTLWAKWAAFAFGLPIVSFVNLLPPVAFGLLQNTCKASDLGQRMAGVQAALDFASAIGPLFFGLLYGNLTNTLMFLPFVICAALVVPPMFITTRLVKWMKEEQEGDAEPSQAA